MTPPAWARLAATLSRLRASQPGHRIVRRWRGRGTGAVPAARPTGLAPLPPESRRPLAPPFDHETADGWRLGGGVVPRGPDGGPAWDVAPSSRLALFHAHYFDWARGLAEAGYVTRAAAGVAAWAAARRRHPDDARHPYVRARRILSLVEAGALGVAVGGARRRGRGGARAHARARRRRRHLLCDAVALFRAGHALAGPASARRRATGSSLLSAAARGQVLADGHHFERSPAYLALVLEHLLVALETAAAAGEAPPPGVEAAARRGARALGECLLPDGALLRWKDGVEGLSPPVPGLLAWAERRAGPLEAPRRGRRLSEAAGLAVLETPDGRSAATLLAGPACPRDLPAHGHADALAYEAVFDGVRVVASAGTADYAPGPSRDADRLPGAFAGVLLDGAAPADPYGAFRVGARGVVRALEGARPGFGCAAGAASWGFRATGGRSVHHRALWLVDGPVLACVDAFTGEGGAEATLFWPLGPGLSARVEGESAVVTGAAGTWRLTAPGFALSLEEGRFATALGTTVPRTVIRGTTRLALPARRVHAWTSGEAPAEVEAQAGHLHETRVEVRSGGRTWVGHVPEGTAA